MYIAQEKIPPFTPLIISTEMKTINKFGHDINAFVLPYDPATGKAELLIFDAHGLIPKPWCKERNFDSCYTAYSLDVFDSDEARDNVQAWMEKTPSYNAWRDARVSTEQDSLDETCSQDPTPALN